MNVSMDKVNQQQTLIIEMGEKFDFSKVEAFRSAYQDLDSDVKHITVDLAKTEYMDSSALGMLLNMQKVLSHQVALNRVSLVQLSLTHRCRTKPQHNQ